MNYYETCPWCGANLDPGEKCDCAGADHVPPKPLTAVELHVGDRVMYIGGTYSAKRYPERYPGVGTVGTVTLIDKAENPGTDIYVRWPMHGRPALLHPVKAMMLARSE